MRAQTTTPIVRSTLLGLAGLGAAAWHSAFTHRIPHARAIGRIAVLFGLRDLSVAGHVITK